MHVASVIVLALTHVIEAPTSSKMALFSVADVPAKVSVDDIFAALLGGIRAQLIFPKSIVSAEFSKFGYRE